MSVYEIVFSPTGGTKKVSGILARGFGAESTVIDLLQRDRDFSSCVFEKEDLCIVAVPSYGGRVPAPAVLRLGQMKGNGAKAVLTAVYGNRAYEDTLAELQDVLETSGFSCIAAVAAVAEHSIMRQFAAGRPDASDEKMLSEFAKNICSKIKSQGPEAPFEIPGSRPYREYSGVPIKPKAGSGCIRCGHCAAECPVGAILAEDPAETDPKACISCMRCIAVCKNNARSVDKALLTASSMKLKKACSGRKENELFL